MGKLLVRVGSVTNWIAYGWLITTEAFDEIFYLNLIDPLRELLSAGVLKDSRARADWRRGSQTTSGDRQGTLVVS